MRNIDKIKQLEKELGRYQKKVVDQQKELNTLKEKHEDLRQACDALHIASNMVFAYLCERFGEEKKDDDGTLLAYRLVYDKEELASALDRFEVHNGIDSITGKNFVAAMPRERKQEEKLNV